MNKIKILNKEFEVGDMVEVDFETNPMYPQPETAMSAIGYITSIDVGKIKIQNVGIGGVDCSSVPPIDTDTITSINKLVYEPN